MMGRLVGIAAVISTLALSACSHQSVPIPEPDPAIVYSPPASQPGRTATLTGAPIATGAPEHTDTALSNIDGWIVRNPPAVDGVAQHQPVALTPGPHAIAAICAGHWGLARALMRLEAIPDHAYTVKCSYDHIILGPTRIDLWIEDASGAKVASAVGEVFGGGGTNTIFIPIVLPRK
jgi:hypothetical protein